MAQSIEQITQTIRALEAQAGELGDKLYTAYQGYRSAVGQTAQQQLVMACFTLCTEAYPEEFLALALHERNQLQAKIRQAAQQMQTDLIEKLPHPQDEAPPEALPEPKLNPFAMLTGQDESSDGTSSHARSTDGKPSDIPDINSIEEELRALLSLESLLPTKSNQPKNVVEKILQWQDAVEDGTIELLRQTSKQLNLGFQKAGLIPAQIPAPILEAAAHTDGGDPFGKTPHLLRMVLEAREVHRDDGGDRSDSSAEQSAKRRRREDKRNTQPPKIVPIIAVQLRLVELEFNDTNLISWRNQIRELSKQMKSLAKDYQKKQREQAIVNARLAWQSTWTKD
jgi:hypothetical protein